MTISRSSRRSGTGLAAIAVLTALGSGAAAETVSTINGTAIDSSVLDLYIESRTQQPAVQVDAEQRAAYLSELEDVYLLATQPGAKEIESSERMQAQFVLQTTSLLAQTFASEYITGMEITEEEIVAEYEQQASEESPVQFKARHILVESQGEAEAIIEELRQGVDFQELARQRSTGPSGPNGGDLGWFSPEQMVAPFSDAVASMEDGSYSGTPVQTQFGWHVILREETRESEPPPLDSVREQIRQAVQQKRFQAYLEQIRFSASR